MPSSAPVEQFFSFAELSQGHTDVAWPTKHSRNLLVYEN